MSLNLRLLLGCFSIVSFIIIFMLLKKEKMPVRYSLVWFLSSLVILMLSIFPLSLSQLALFIGFQTTSNFIVAIILVLLLFITLILTMIISTQNKKITLLIQEVSILKDRGKNL